MVIFHSYVSLPEGKTRKVMKPKTGEAGAMVPASTKIRTGSLNSINYAPCVRSWFVTRIIPQKPPILKLKMGGFPITANYAFLRQIKPLKSMGFWQK